MNGVLEGGGGNNFTLPLANIIFKICRGSTLKIGTFLKVVDPYNINWHLEIFGVRCALVYV